MMIYCTYKIQNIVVVGMYIREIAQWYLKLGDYTVNPLFGTGLYIENSWENLFQRKYTMEGFIVKKACNREILRWKNGQWIK